MSAARRNKPGPVQIAATVVFVIVLLISTLCSLILTISKFTIFNYDYYEKQILTDEYYDAVRNEIEANIDSQAVSRIFTELTEENRAALKNSIIYDTDDPESIAAYSKAFLASIVSRLKTGSEIPPIDYRNEAYRTQIRRIITDFSYEIGIEDEAEINDAAEDAYDELRSEIAGIISIIGTENWNKVPSFAGLYRSANVWFVPIILTAASALAILLVNANRKTTAYYYMVFPMWFAALILFVPSVMLSIYNVPVRIRGSLIATSFPLVNVYIAGFISNFIQMVLTTLLIVFAVLTIFLLLSILSNANHHGSHYVKNHHHHSGSSDDNIDLVL